MPRVTFRIDYPQAKQIFIVGDFNQWNSETHPLEKRKKGYWSTTINLPPGKYQYRYLVDGQWFTDPATQRVPNEFGSENSVIVVT